MLFPNYDLNDYVLTYAVSNVKYTTIKYIFKFYQQNIDKNIFDKFNLEKIYTDANEYNRDITCDIIKFLYNNDVKIPFLCLYYSVIYNDLDTVMYILHNNVVYCSERQLHDLILEIKEREYYVMREYLFKILIK